MAICKCNLCLKSAVVFSSSEVNNIYNNFVGLKSCTIGKDDLADGLRVLYLKDELFYEGSVKAIQPPDV